MAVASYVKASAPPICGWSSWRWEVTWYPVHAVLSGGRGHLKPYQLRKGPRCINFCPPPTYIFSGIAAARDVRFTGDMTCGLGRASAVVHGQIPVVSHGLITTPGHGWVAVLATLRLPALQQSKAVSRRASVDTSEQQGCRCMVVDRDKCWTWNC